MTRHRLEIVILAACIASLAPSGVEMAGAQHFSGRILPLLQEQFAPLLERETGLSLESWESLMAGSDFGEVVIPFDAEGSLLIKLAIELSDDDPLSAVAAALDPDDIDVVRQWIDQGARDDDGSVAYADAKNLLYACSQGAATISVIDMDAQVVIRTIRLEELGFTPDARPHHTAVEPDGAHWYVSLIGDDKVLKFNRENELVGQLTFERPGMLALHPDEDLLFVGRSMKAVNPPRRIGLIRRSTMEIEEFDVFIARPHALAVHRGGGRAYVGSLAENRFATLDWESGEIELRTIDGPTHTLVQFAVSPDGTVMVVGGQLTGNLFFFDTSDPGNPTITDTLSVGAAPWHPVFSPGGQYVWLGNKMAGTATVVHMESRSVDAVIEGLSQPHGAAMSPDGRRVFVSNNNLAAMYPARYDFGYAPGVITIIDAETRAVTKSLEVGPNATGLGTATR